MHLFLPCLKKEGWLLISFAEFHLQRSSPSREMPHIAVTGQSCSNGQMSLLGGTELSWGAHLCWATGTVAHRFSGPTGKGSSAPSEGVQLSTLCIFPLLCQQVTGLLGYMGQSSEDRLTGNPEERTAPKRSPSAT